MVTQDIAWVDGEVHIPRTRRNNRCTNMYLFMHYFYMWIPMVNSPYGIYDPHFLAFLYKKKIRKKILRIM